MDCPVCSAKGRPWGEKAGYPLERCAHCQHLYTSRRPEPAVLTAHYERYSYDRSSLESIPPFVIQRLAGILAPLRRPGRTRVLDVGFGAGALLRAATDLGFDAVGIETSALAVAQGRNHGFNVVEADFATSTLPDAAFDVVCMIELVEHLPDPQAFLVRAHRLLARDGTLLLTTPNGSGVSARALGPGWSAVGPPEHLQLFSPASLHRTLEQAGFRHVRVRCEGVNPYELMACLRRPGDGDTPAVDRVATSYALNQRMTSNRLGRLAKAGANAVLSATRLGDSLKALATP